MIKIKIGGADSRDCQIKVDSEKSLGLIQSFSISASVFETTKLRIESVLTDAEIEILENETEIKVIK